MLPESKYARPTIPQDSSSSSTLAVNILPRRKIERRPPTEGDNSSPSTLDGMERTGMRTRSPISTATIEAIIDMYGERPLPPVPRIPSSVYSASKRNTAFASNSPISPESPGVIASPPIPVAPSPVIVTEKGLKLADAKHLSQLFQKGSRRKSNTPNVSRRQKFVEGARSSRTPVAKTNPAKPVPFTEWRAPTYQEPSTSPKSTSSIPPSQRSTSFDCPRSSSPTRKTADRRAESYFAAIQPTNPITFDRAPNCPVSSKPTDSPPFSSEATTTKTIKNHPKQSFIPYPILTSSLPSSIDPPQSHFSPSSPQASDIDIPAGVASSLRTRAKKALLQSKIPNREQPSLRQRVDSTQSGISHVSPMTTRPPSRRGSNPVMGGQPRDSVMQRGLNDIYDSLQSMYTPSQRESVKLPGESVAKNHFERADQLSYTKKRLPGKEVRLPAVPLTEYQKHGLKAWEGPLKRKKENARVLKSPRRRLSRPQLAPVMTNTKSPDTTYKIEMPSPPTPKRPKSTLLFDHTYHIEMPSSTAPTTSEPVTPTRAITVKSSHLSRTFTRSNHGSRFSNRLNRAERRRMERFSLPAPETELAKHGDNETMVEGIARQATASSTDAKKGKSIRERLKSTFPGLGLVRRETEPLLTLGMEKDEDSIRNHEQQDRNGSKVRQSSSERRREDLKKRIVLVGELSAVGVPF